MTNSTVHGAGRKAPKVLSGVILVLLVMAVLGGMAPGNGSPVTAAASEIINEKDGTVLVSVPGATFTMGSDDAGLGESPPHSVSLPSYWIGKVPVTNAQFRQFVSATGYDAGSDWELNARRWGGQAPVTCVSWHDARAYCRWAGLRLPTEAEWEYAARGVQGRTYPWGNDWEGGNRAWWRENSGRRAHPVGSKPSNASWCGALDMSGNAWQWCSSRYRPYPYQAGDGREDVAGGEKRVLRGGSYANANPRLFRGAARDTDVPDSRIGAHSFRCAKDR